MARLHPVVLATTCRRIHSVRRRLLHAKNRFPIGFCVFARPAHSRRLAPSGDAPAKFRTALAVRRFRPRPCRAATPLPKLKAAWTAAGPERTKRRVGLGADAGYGWVRLGPDASRGSAVRSAPHAGLSPAAGPPVPGRSSGPAGQSGSSFQTRSLRRTGGARAALHPAVPSAARGAAHDDGKSGACTWLRDLQILYCEPVVGRDACVRNGLRHPFPHLGQSRPHAITT